MTVMNFWVVYKLNHTFGGLVCENIKFMIKGRGGQKLSFFGVT